MIDDILDKIKNNKKTLFLILDISVVFLYLFLMAYSFSRPLRNFVNAVTGNSIIVITIYFLLFYVLYFIFSFPSKYFQGLEQIKAQGFKEWFDALIKKEIFIFFIMFFAIQVVYFFLEGDVVWWWLPVSIFCFLVKIIIEYGAKYVTACYLRSESMDESELKKRLIEICSRADLKITNVFYQQGLKARAVILGFGPIRRLMLNKELENYAQEEIEIIVAQEIAYYRYRFIRKKLMIEAAGIFASFLILNILLRPVSAFFGFEFIFDIETLPVIVGLFFISFLVMSFVQNYFFRNIERSVCMYALKQTQAPDAFISLIIRDKNKADKVETDNFISQLLNGGLTELEKMSLAQDYAQELAVKQKIKQMKKEEEKKK